LGFTYSDNNGNRASGGGKRAPSRKNIKRNTASAKLFLAGVLVLLAAFLAVVCYTLSQPENVDPSQGQTDEGSLQSEAASSLEELSTVSPLSTAKPVTTTKSSSTTKKQQLLPSPGIIKINPDNWELTLVNTRYRLPEGYVPPKLLTVVNDCRLDSRVVPHYLDMYNAALEDGVKLTPFSGYRSYEMQERNYNNKIRYYQGEGYNKAEAAVKAAAVIMPPGSSEHNLGVAMDIVTCDSWFETTDEFTWLRENAYKYGFIMRYAKEKTDITGVIYEPWHWRYVGVKTATDIYKTRNAEGVEICLEEYLGVSK